MKYSQFEIKIGQFASLITHIPMFFLGFLMLHKKYHFEYVLGMADVIFSTCYHVFDLSETEFLMKPRDWHRLDNICGISYLSLLIIEFINESRQIKLNLKVIIFVFTIILQTREPFDLLGTIFPVLLALCLLLVYTLTKGPISVNLRPLAKGILFMSVAVFFFVKGLDDDHDYLRLNHSVWHVFMALGAFNLYQIGDKSPISLGESSKYASSLLSAVY